MSRGRKIIVAFGVVFLLIFGAAVWILAWCFTAKPRPRIDYGAKIRELAARDAPNPENRDRYPEFYAIVETVGNAHTAFREQAKAAGKSDDIKYERVIRGTATEEEGALADEALAFVTASGAFEKCKELPGLRGAVRTIPQGQQLIYVALPGIGHVRTAARLQALRLVRAVEADDAEAAAAALAESLAMSQIISYQGLLLDAMTALKARLVLADAITHQCDVVGVSPAEARRMLPTLLEHAQTPDIGRAIDIERNLSLDLIQWLYTDNGRGDGKVIWSEIGVVLTPERQRPSKLQNVRGLFLPSRKAAEAHIHEAFDILVEMTHKPFVERQQTSEESVFTFNLNDYPVTSVMYSSFKRSGADRDRSQQSFNAAMIALALVIHRDAHGTYPASLAELAPSILPSVPTDPIAPDGQFRYALRDGALLLYSVGPDGDDDGGEAFDFEIQAYTEPTEQSGDTVFWGREKKGTEARSHEGTE